MQHDLRLRAAVRAIYEACYPGDAWALYSFDEAERTGALHYRMALDAACAARSILADATEQLSLFAAA